MKTYSTRAAWPAWLALAAACVMPGSGAAAQPPSGAAEAAPDAVPASQAGKSADPAGSLAVAKDGAASSAAAAPQATLYWYDGPMRRPLRLDARYAARFDAAGKSVEAADVVVPAGLAGKDAAIGTAAASPLLRDASGAPRALPGGVIVTLPEPAAEAQARARLRALGAEPLRPLGAGGRVWLVASEPGLASLELANRLHETGAVSAQPNWWQPRALK